VKPETTHCRLSNAGYGISAHIEVHRLVRPENASDLEATPRKDAQPLKRTGSDWTAVSWEEANEEIGRILRKVRSTHGPESIGVYLGEPAQKSARTFVRSLAFGVGCGTPHIFSESSLTFGPQLWATEKMVGHAAALMSDLERAHYVILLSGEQRDLGWGPNCPGQGHEGWLQHSRKTKKTRVVVADPRKTELSETMDIHLAIRPGSEPYLLLGMLTAIVQGGWTDEQFIRDYTDHYDRLQALVSNWRVDQFAELCGLEAPELSGVALKFSRAAMGLIHPARQSFLNEAGSIGAWAWLAIHAVTANLLRPGGLFENEGMIDLFPLLAQLTSEKAPKTRATQYPLVLMQAPAAAMPTEIMDGPVRALISVSGNPVGRLPSPRRTQDALQGLDVLVHIGDPDDPAAQLADWILPAAEPWQEAGLSVDNTSRDGPLESKWTAPVGNIDDSTRSADHILQGLYRALRPGLRGSAWGKHLGLMAQYIARTDLEKWEERFLSDWANETASEWATVLEQPFDWKRVLDDGHAAQGTQQIHIGEADRALWRPSTESERIDVLPEEVEQLFQSWQIPSPGPLILRSGQCRGPDQDPNADVDAQECPILVHPDLGWAEGDRVTLSTAHGSCVGTISLDERLRSDTVDVPFFEGSPVLDLLSDVAADPVVGTTMMDGISVTIQRA